MQDYGNSKAGALELPQSCAKPLISLVLGSWGAAVDLSHCQPTSSTNVGTGCLWWPADSGAFIASPSQQPAKSLPICWCVSWLQEVAAWNTQLFIRAIHTGSLVTGNLGQTMVTGGIDHYMPSVKYTMTRLLWTLVTIHSDTTWLYHGPWL